jgi:hypothetical protein
MPYAPQGVKGTGDNDFFFLKKKNPALYKIMLKCMGQPDRPQITI